MIKISMKNILKDTFFILIISTVILAAGCGAGTEVPSGEQEGAQTEEQGKLNDSGQETNGLTGFRTQDIYGGDFDQSIFKDYTLTMVNVWGTFCGPCLDEMPDLGELQKEYEPKGVNIVGIVIDVQDNSLKVIEKQQELAKEIAETTGAGYTHLIISEEMIDPVLSKFDSIPASFFVDSGGNIVSEFYIGSREKEDWVDIIETNLEKQK